MLKREHNNDSNSTPYMIGLAEPDRPFRLRDYIFSLIIMDLRQQAIKNLRRLLSQTKENDTIVAN